MRLDLTFAFPGWMFVFSVKMWCDDAMLSDGSFWWVGNFVHSKYIWGAVNCYHLGVKSDQEFYLYVWWIVKLNYLF